MRQNRLNLMLVASIPPTRPAVTLYLDRESWHSFAFTVGARLCLRTFCESTVIDPASGLGDTRGDGTTVFLTSFGGRPSDVLLPRAPPMSAAHFNAAVFMENDARFFLQQGGESALKAHLESTFYNNLDLALGFAANCPAGNGAKGPHWQQLSYIDDSIDQFLSPPVVAFDAMLKSVAFFSSQCSPHFAQPRVELMEALLGTALGSRIMSFGTCFHNADLGEVLPECKGLPVNNVDHGKH